MIMLSSGGETTLYGSVELVMPYRRLHAKHTSRYRGQTFLVKTAFLCAVALQETPRLRELDLSNSTIQDRGAKQIADLLRAAPNLMSVHVSEKGLTEEGAQCLLDALSGDPIRCSTLWDLLQRVMQA